MEIIQIVMYAVVLVIGCFLAKMVRKMEQLVTKEDFEVLVQGFSDAALSFESSFTDIATELLNLHEQLDKGGLPPDVELDVKNRLTGVSDRLKNVAKAMADFAKANKPEEPVVEVKPVEVKPVEPAPAEQSTEPAPTESAPPVV